MRDLTAAEVLINISVNAICLKMKKKRKLTKTQRLPCMYLKLSMKDYKQIIKKMLIGLTIIIMFLDSQINLRVVYRHLLLKINIDIYL